MPDTLLHTSNDTRSVQDIVSSYTQLADRWRSFRRRQSLNYRYVVGDMLDKDVREELRKEGRPALEFQIANKYAIYMAGKIKRDSTKMKAFPVSSQDVDGTEMATKLVNDYAMNGCGGYDEIAKIALDAAIGGMGFCTQYWDMSKDEQGRYMLRWVDPFLVMFDPDAKRQDQEDWRYLIYAPCYTVDEIISIYKSQLDEDKIKFIRAKAQEIEGKRTTDNNTPVGWQYRIGEWGQTMWQRTDNWWRGGTAGNSSHTWKFSGSSYLDWVNDQMGLYRVGEWHDKRYETNKFVMNFLSGQKQPVPQMDKDAEKEWTVNNLPSDGSAMLIEETREVLYMTVAVPGLMPDDVVMEKKYPVQDAGFSIKPCFCHDFHPDVTQTQSIIDPLRAPIDFTNQRTMTLLEAGMRYLNPSYRYQKTSIDKGDMDKWTSKMRSIMKPFLGQTPPTPDVPPSEGAQLIMELMKYGGDLVEDVSGISPNAMGFQETSKESGALVQRRLMAADVMTAHLMSNIQEAMKPMFQYCYETLKVFMRDEREIALLQDGDQPSFMTVNQQTPNGTVNPIMGNYKFVVDSEALGETTRQSELAMMQTLIPMLPDPKPWPIFLKYLPTTLGQKLADYYANLMGIQLDEKQKQQQQQELAAKVGVAHAALDLKRKHEQSQLPPHVQEQGQAQAA